MPNLKYIALAAYKIYTYIYLQIQEFRHQKYKYTITHMHACMRAHTPYHTHTHPHTHPFTHTQSPQGREGLWRVESMVFKLNTG